MKSDFSEIHHGDLTELNIEAQGDTVTKIFLWRFFFISLLIKIHQFGEYKLLSGITAFSALLDRLAELLEVIVT